MRRSRAFLVFAVLAMGQTEGDCEEQVSELPVWFDETVLYNGEPDALPAERSRAWHLAQQGHDAIEVNGTPRFAKADKDKRIELYLYDPDVPDPMDHPFGVGSAFYPALKVGTGAVIPYPEGVVVAFQGEGHSTPIDLFERFPGFEHAAVVYAVSRDEGAASVRIPWDTSEVPVDPDYAATLAPFIGGGAGPLVLRELGLGLAGGGSSETFDNLFYYGDYTQDVFFDDPWFDDQVQHELYVDLGVRRAAFTDTDVWRVDDLPRADRGRVCIRSRYFTGGHINWTPDVDPWRGEQWAYLFGGGLLLDLFGVGSCGARLGEVTTCMRLSGVGGATPLTPAGQALVFVERSDGALDTELAAAPLRATTEAGHALINGWPSIKFGCNANKATMESTLAAIVHETLPVSIQTFAREAFALIGVSCKDAQVTAEGLLCVVADDTAEPAFAAAWARGFANRDTIPASRTLTRTTIDHAITRDP